MLTARVRAVAGLVLVAAAVGVGTAGCTAPTPPVVEEPFPIAMAVEPVDDWPDAFDKGPVSADRFHDVPAGWIDGGRTLGLVIVGSGSREPGCNLVPDRVTAIDATTIEVAFAEAPGVETICLQSLNVWRWTAEVPDEVALAAPVEVRFLVDADDLRAQQDLSGPVTLDPRSATPESPDAEPTGFTPQWIGPQDEAPGLPVFWNWSGQQFSVSFAGSSTVGCVLVPSTATAIDATTVEIAFIRAVDGVGGCTDDLAPYLFSATPPAGTSRVLPTTFVLTAAPEDVGRLTAQGLPDELVLPARGGRRWAG